ncbi:MAG: hypothetical protein E7612_10885 [Ruminococcaceae bacterium]|nr:hypothetical protein [Oscillospiraceae bacterium]
MTKKLLCVVLLVISLVCAFTSCGYDKETPAHTHSYGEWETTKAATCTAEGSKERYCSCGEKQTSTISITEHSYGEWEIVKEATYAEKGSESRKCTCGQTETRDIAKKESETKTLTVIECYNELFNCYSNMLKEPSISYKEDGEEYSIYNDGVNTIIHIYSKRLDGDTIKEIERWYGKYGNNYVYAYCGNGSKYYEIISKEDYDRLLENYRSDILHLIEELLRAISNRKNVECVKTIGEIDTYIIKASNRYDTDTVDVIIVKARDGLITEIQDYDTSIIYRTDVIVTLPNFSNWEQR